MLSGEVENWLENVILIFRAADLLYCDELKLQICLNRWNVSSDGWYASKTDYVHV